MWKEHWAGSLTTWVAGSGPIHAHSVALAILDPEKLPTVSQMGLPSVPSELPGVLFLSLEDP
jgi:hypothetical protein